MRFTPTTIRGQIVMAFMVCFILMGAMIIVNDSGFRRLSRSMQFFDLAEELNSTILEMRRYEKNYFLYRQAFSYEENITYTNKLQLMLHRERESLVSAIGQKNYQHFLEYVKDYASRLAELQKKICTNNACSEQEAKIRGVGQNLLTLADQLVVTERRAISHLLQQMIPLPLISLLALVVLLGFVVFYVGEKVVRPLARITRESEAVAQGAFKRITPYGGDKNEIHHLVSAINRMMEELEKRQDQLVQSRKIASIGTLTAGVAHEINNPINNLSLILESLIEEGREMTPEERAKLYQEAMDQADRTSEIVKNLLEFSRASHPRVEMVDIDAIVDKTARLISNELNLNAITFSKEVTRNLPQVRLDRGGLQQVLLNLFLNAIQAIGRGGELRVIIDTDDVEGAIRIDVIDSGPGIAPENMGQVFDPFFTTKKDGVGTGLGLSVSYNIIKKNGGRMEVKSTPGQGACFTIILPFRAPEEP